MRRWCLDDVLLVDYLETDCIVCKSGLGTGEGMYIGREDLQYKEIL